MHKENVNNIKAEKYNLNKIYFEKNIENRFRIIYGFVGKKIFNFRL